MNQIMGNVKQRLKSQRGFTAIELGIVALALVVLAAVGIMAWNGYLDGQKRAVAHHELRMLADACGLYTASAKSGNPPADLGALVTGLTAAQSNDNTAKGPFVTKASWTTDASTFIDPWGNAYTYTAASRTLSCSNNGGTAFTETF